MAKIPLRAYNREIESYIEQGRTDEAIAHSRHILKFHAKHLDTYRLLGKAFLESQRYGEAADILQRVLSAVPDDFISQIGMSIIREDEGNLDAAIFHMERAHEIQPSNTAIQEELRRLYGRRDGVEPPKIRLTRGALVRLYARGDLYPQAIAEIRAALAENPNRVDLEVILARMYFLTGQKVEAAEVCSHLVSKLPYCFEANRILAEVLPGTSRADDARIYQQRVYALDPYLEHVTPSTPLATDVPEGVVSLERLEFDPSVIEAQAPGWAQSLGVDWEDTGESQPEWMAEEAAPVETVESAVEEAPAGEPDPTAQEAEIPDFLATAGWMVADGEEQPPEEFTEEEEDIAPAEIPDWLQSMAPELESESPEEDEEAARWLESILPADETAAEVSDVDLELPEDLKSLEALLTEETAETEPAITDEELPATLPAEPVSDLAAGQQEDADDTGELPDWLTSIEIESSLEETEAVEPDWLAGLAASGKGADDFKVEEADSSEEEIPEWMRTIETEPGAETGEMAEPAQALSEAGEAEEVSEFLNVEPTTFGSDGAKPEAEGEMPPLEDLDATMAWLENLAAKHGADEATLSTRPDERLETPPDWVSSLMAESETEETVPAPAVTDEPETVESAAEPAAEDETFAWLEVMEAGEEAGEAVQPPEIAPGWIAGIDEPVQEVTVEPAGVEQVEALDADNLPDWLSEALSEEDKGSTGASAAEAEWVPESEISSLTADAAEADAVEPVETEPAVLEEAQPVVEEVMEEAEPVEAPVELAPAEAVDIPAAESEEPIPEWLQDLVDEDLPAELTEAKTLEEMPEWLETIDGSQPVEAVTAEVEPEPAEVEPEVAAAAPEPAREEAAVTAPTPMDGWASVLEQAQADLAKEQIDPALERYAQLIQSGACLDETIHDLREALYRYPVDVSIWQTLGDAYARANMLQDALDAYTKAEELLR